MEKEKEREYLAKLGDGGSDGGVGGAGEVDRRQMGRGR
jgi:hypothetical protein